jgi:CHAT domain
MTMPSRVSPARDHRWRRLGLAAACLVPPLFGVSWVAYRWLSASAGYATWAAGIQTLAIALSAALAARAAWAARLTGRRQLDVVLASWALLPALTAALLAVAVGVPVGWAALLGVAAGVAAAVFYARLRGRVTALQTVVPLQVETLAEAELLRLATQQPGEDLKLSADQRAVQRLNHARALTFLAMRDDDHHRLVEALPLLRAAVQDPALDPSVALMAASNLVDAESMLAERGRDGGRYGEALDLYARLVEENPGIPAGPPSLHTARAGYQKYLGVIASEDLLAAESAGDETAAGQARERLRTTWRAVEQELVAAVALTDPRTGLHAECLVMLGSHLCTSFDLLDEYRSDEGIGLCRKALSLRAGRTRDQRPLTELSLALCLTMRAEQREDHRDWDEAEALLHRLLRRGNPVEARARRLLLDIAVLREQAGPAREPRQARGADVESGGVRGRARAAFRAGLADATVDMTQVADAYVSWAREHGTPAELAEAYWMRSVVTAREAMRRELPAGRLRVLADSEHVAAEAGYWLASAGQVREAVIAVESSRGILLTRLAGGLDAEIRARLLTAGRADLLRSYMDALRRRADAYRNQYGGDPAPAPLITRGGRSFRAGTASALEEAQADVARLAGEVSAVVGGMDPLDLPSYRAIRRAAGQAPVVYLAVAEQAGYALIVRGETEPVFVPLPRLRPDVLAGYRESFSRPPLPTAVTNCVDWLAEALEDVVLEVSGEPETAAVPLGALNLLPVHAALIQATSDRPSGAIAVRYLPNARVVAGAPGWLDPGIPGSVLAIDVAEPHCAPGADPLRLVRGEAEALVRRYGARRLADATTDEVLRWLPSADMVQFLCHGKADLNDPLMGGLLLTDGWLTVRTLLSRPPLRRQLVILAACESQVGGTTAPDEIVGLPAALYQAGAAGVVAAQWQVEEPAALVLLRKFHDHLRGGTSPARALACAQNWLRTATYAEMTSAYPELFASDPPPGDAAMAAKRAASVPYAEAVHWAAFGYTGI